MLLASSDSHQFTCVPVAGKQFVEVLDVLLGRLDDHQAVVRTNAAFSILKVSRYSCLTIRCSHMTLSGSLHLYASVWR